MPHRNHVTVEVRGARASPAVSADLPLIGRCAAHAWHPMRIAKCDCRTNANDWDRPAPEPALATEASVHRKPRVVSRGGADIG